MKNIAKAIISVMQEVKGIDKSMTVGTGSSSYKGVPDKEVKKIIGAAMAKNGLTILPTSVNAKTRRQPTKKPHAPTGQDGDTRHMR